MHFQTYDYVSHATVLYALSIVAILQCYLLEWRQQCVFQRSRKLNLVKLKYIKGNWKTVSLTTDAVPQMLTDADERRMGLKIVIFAHSH